LGSVPLSIVKTALSAVTFTLITFPNDEVYAFVCGAENNGIKRENINIKDIYL
jgi:hypothetical protein